VLPDCVGPGLEPTPLRRSDAERGTIGVGGTRNYWLLSSAEKRKKTAIRNSSSLARARCHLNKDSQLISGVVILNPKVIPFLLGNRCSERPE
jgi:hypothetical protein